VNAFQEATALGQSGVIVPQMGIGAWAWGDRLVWGFGKEYAEAEVREAFDASLEAGINFFDTAEVYGQGRSEKLLGSFLAQTDQPVRIATKFMPFPWRLRKKDLHHALRRSLDRLGLERVGLYQIHFPMPVLPVERWAEALAEVVEAGLVEAVGVSNYSEAQMRRTYSVLARRGIPLASNQVDYSLLNRRVERSGLLKACRELNVTLIAYSPLAQGILTGKYTPENPPGGVRGRRNSRTRLEQVQPLIGQLREIGQLNGGKTPSQVALNWCICKGTLPIPGAKNAKQALENAGALGWQLTEAEVAALDRASGHLS
jgi:aryl-alcohol dehydrogenase-like predicted oxidoreductase